MLTRLAFKTIGTLASILPRRCQYAIAHRLADAHYLLDREARDSVWANLRVILGEEAPESIVRREARWVFRSFGMYLCEFFGYGKFGPAYIDQHVTVEGREYLDRALAGGHGAVLCSAHYSNWELGATVVAHMGYPIMAVAQMHTDPKTNDIFVKQRTTSGVQVVDSQHAGKASLKALRRNQFTALMGDRTTGGPVVPVTIFGRKTYLPQGPWRIALISGAAVLPIFMQRRFNYGYRLEIDAPIVVPHEGTRDERMAVMAQQWADSFAARVKADPCQWTVFRRVWDDPSTGALGSAQTLALSLIQPDPSTAADRSGVEAPLSGEKRAAPEKENAIELK